MAFNSNIYISSAFPHENYGFHQPVYIRQRPRFDGSFKHPFKGGGLVKNIYGTPSGGYYYLTPATAYLRSIGFRQSMTSLVCSPKIYPTTKLFSSVSTLMTF